MVGSSAISRAGRQDRAIAIITRWRIPPDRLWGYSFIRWLPQILRLLPSGGVLLSDNVLQDGDIVESRYAVERRNRTIHTRMRDYLYELTHMKEFETSVIPIGDGVALSVKR